MKREIAVKRVYTAAGNEDGVRVLVGEISAKGGTFEQKDGGGLCDQPRLLR